jgi:vacuolar-type H+-ATPase subunit E/Vma4
MAIGLTVIIGILQLLLGGLGVYVSLRTPKKEHHWKWMSCFTVVGLFGIVLTGWLASEEGQAQQRANEEIHKAQIEASNANTAATNANVAATNAAKAATTAQHETEIARSEQHKDSSATQSLINQKSTETNKNILSYRSDTESAVSKILRPPRTLGDKRTHLIEALKKAGAHEIAITSARGNEDALNFGNEIELAFKEAGWIIVPTQKLTFITKEGTGLSLVVKGTTDEQLRPDQIAVGMAFKSIGMQLKGAPGEQGNVGPVELYVGLP